MTMFYDENNLPEEEELTVEAAEAIYEDFKEGKKETKLFKEGVSFEKSGKVKKEYKRLEKEILSKVSGSWVVTKAVYDEFGELVTPAEYYTVTTQQALADSLDVDLLNSDTVLSDCIKWNPTKDATRTWTAFKEYYESLSE